VNKVQKVKYKQVEEMCAAISEQVTASGALEQHIKNIYGIPRGGVPVAFELGSFLGLPLVEKPDQHSLIVDDIADSGKTISRFPKHITATLFLKPHCKVKPNFYAKNTNAWVQFPWETAEAPSEDAIVRVIEVLGEDPSREGLLDTPKRVIKSYGQLYAGYNQNPKDILKTTFEGEGYDQIVLLKNIEFYSTCEHHMLPFFGKAHVAYIPRKRVVGLSKLARLVECFSRRLQIQERLTSQIAQSLDEILEPTAVGVIMEAQHFCMVARGVQKQNATMTTSSLLGLFKQDEKARAEFMRLVGQK